MICNMRITINFNEVRLIVGISWIQFVISFYSSVTCCSLHPRFSGEIHFDGDLMSCEQSRERTGTLTGVWWPVPGAVASGGSGQVYRHWTGIWREESSVQSRYTSQRWCKWGLGPRNRVQCFSDEKSYSILMISRERVRIIPNLRILSWLKHFVCFTDPKLMTHWHDRSVKTPSWF